MTDAKQLERVRHLLACFLLGSFVGALVAFTFKDMPSANKDILTYMVGQLSGMATTVLAFYFTKGAGQDQLDAQKTENTGKMADAITAAAKAGSIDAAGDAAVQVADAAVEKAEEITDGR